MIMYASEVEAKEKLKPPELKKINYNIHIMSNDS